MREKTPQREHPLRKLFNGPRWIVRTGSQRRYLPHNFPPRPAVYPQSRRSMGSHIYLQIAGDLRRLLRELGTGASQLQM